jgi:hypothetical protein
MLKLGIPVLFAVAVLGCGSGGGTDVTPPPGGPSTYPLPGATQLDIQAGDCVIVNAQPQTLPASTVSYTLVDSDGTDTVEVGVVPSTYTCQFDPNQAYVDDIFTGSATDSSQVPAGTYDLDIICQNALGDCLINSATWSATY